MKEYEYIIKGIDTFLADELVGVICQESLENELYPDGFRRIFDNYVALRSGLLTKLQDLDLPDIPESDLSSIEKEWKRKREEYLQTFLKGIDDNYPDLDIHQIAKKYQEDISKEDVISTEKRVCIYPYLVSQVRLHEKRKFENGHNN